MSPSRTKPKNNFMKNQSELIESILYCVINFYERPGGCADDIKTQYQTLADKVHRGNLELTKMLLLAEIMAEVLSNQDAYGYTDIESANETIDGYSNVFLKSISNK